MPYFSICIPTYNRKKLLKRNLEYLEKQSFSDFEVIIVDDGSIDETNVFVNDFSLTSKLNISYFYQKNSGKYKALNIAIKNAIGKYFIIIDSDDYLLENALEQMHHIAKKYNEKYGVIGKAVNFDKKIIGDVFPNNIESMSYVDFHFNYLTKKFGDCCECNLTSYLKENLFPESYATKFIPESYVFNNLGLSNKLVVTNEIFKVIDYQTDGITNNYNNGFKEKNYLGYLLDYTNDINNIFVNSKVKWLSKLKIWIKYWHLKEYDLKNEAPSVKHIGITGNISKCLYKIVFKLKK